MPDEPESAEAAESRRGRGAVPREGADGGRSGAQQLQSLSITKTFFRPEDFLFPPENLLQRETIGPSVNTRTNGPSTDMLLYAGTSVYTVYEYILYTDLTTLGMF